VHEKKILATAPSIKYSKKSAAIYIIGKLLVKNTTAAVHEKEILGPTLPVN